MTDANESGPLLGAHMSIAGGLYKAIDSAAELGMATCQIFTKNNNQWAAKPLTEDAIAAWKNALERTSLQHPIAHASYLINLAAPEEAKWQRSIDGLVVELQRGELLGLDGLVVHPGAYTTSDETTGLERIINGVKQVFEKIRPARCRLLLENTAGQGSNLGYRFTQLGTLINQIAEPDLIGVCLDTCHAFAAGYEINKQQAFSQMMDEIDAELPAGSLRALHLNDSKKECGSRVDRHEHIGFGHIGEAGFRHVLTHPALGKLPGYLETPKGENPETGESYDAQNLATLKRLAAKA